MKRILLSWSSGKDSAWTLHVLQQSDEYQIVGLLTTFNREADGVAMHGVRYELVERQAGSVGLPLWPVLLPSPCFNEQYESIMAGTCACAVSEGIDAIASATCFSKMCGLIAKNSCRTPEWCCSFRSGGYRRVSWPPQ
jgi:diphthamide synthase (EF-2-diphthine--ammonia ligase)